MNRELEAKIHERTHELAEANARLAQLAVTDGLTGLYNHRHFHERLALEVERSQRSGLPLSLLMLDVDHFKQFNDTHGHPAGDEVLRQLARVLADTPPRERRGRALRRRGVRGDPRRHREVHGREGRRARPRARSPRTTSPTPRQKAGKIIVSIGVATFPEDGTDAEALVRAADTALYAAKRAGRNRVVLYTDALGATPSVG